MVKEYGTRAGQPSRSVRSLRHFHATLLLQSGQNVVVVSKRLGLSAVSITTGRVRPLPAGVAETGGGGIRGGDEGSGLTLQEATRVQKVMCDSAPRKDKAPGEEWAVHPMYFDRRESVQRNFPGRYASFPQARLVSVDVRNQGEVAATAIQCRTHLLLDPDSGSRLGKNLEPVRGWRRHLKGAELVRIAQGPGRESRLTLVFADTQRDNFGAKHQRTRAMLAGIRQGHGIHGNGYVSSRMAPVWVSLHGDLVKEATEGLVRSTEVPRWRIFDGGHRAKEGRQ